MIEISSSSASQCSPLGLRLTSRRSAWEPCRRRGNQASGTPTVRPSSSFTHMESVSNRTETGLAEVLIPGSFDLVSAASMTSMVGLPGRRPGGVEHAGERSHAVRPLVVVCLIALSTEALACGPAQRLACARISCGEKMSGFQETAKAAGATATGAAAGFGVAAAVPFTAIGLVGGGVAGVGAAITLPAVLVGGAVGLAGFSLYRLVVPRKAGPITVNKSGPDPVDKKHSNPPDTISQP